MAITIIQMIKM